MKDKVLIVEDELIVARDIRKTLERNGFTVVGVARTAEKVLQLVEECQPSLVLLDIFLKGNLTGIDVASHLNEKNIPFVYVSANSSQQVLEAAKITNPFGFIVKPFRAKDLLVATDIAVFRNENNRKMGLSESSLADSAPRQHADEVKSLSSLMQHFASCENMIGKSASMLKVFNLIHQVAPFDSSVLILGETGTGKEGVANCIVKQSGRWNKPYIRINCAAIPAELMEAEFFGFEKGAFSGANDRKAGKFELAAGGTMLLDEVGEITPEMQAKLLRALQKKEIQRLGSNTVIKTEVRVLAATSKILEKEVAEGRFRLDLYYRLLVFPINIPPLRERKDDIPLLVDYFMQYYSAKTGKKIRTVNPGLIQKLLEYDWPGNVRELQHVMERSILLSREEEILSEIVLPEFASVLQKDDKKGIRTKTLEEIEKDHILSVLKQCNYKITGRGGAAEALNLPPSTLNSKIKKLGIKIFYQ